MRSCGMTGMVMRSAFAADPPHAVAAQPRLRRRPDQIKSTESKKKSTRVKQSFLFARGTGMARDRLDQQRFQAGSISIAQISDNLRVLATFRTQEPGSSNLTIRRGLFYKTTGKLNPLKRIIRDDHDSLTNQAVLDEILTNINRFENHYRGAPTDDTYDILCNAMQGFLNLGSKYRDRGTANNIAQTMSTVCRKAQLLFLFRLERFALQRAAGYSQGVYNRANKVHLDGTCWSMVMDWARRIVLKAKMGYAHDSKYQFCRYNETKLLHRGKYIAHVFGLPQNQNFDDVGAAIKAIDPAQKAQTNDLLQEYYAEQKGSKQTVEQKFSKLSYRLDGNLGLRSKILIGNQHRHNCTNALMDNLHRWIVKSETAYRNNHFYLFTYEIGFFMAEEIGFQSWIIHEARQRSEAPPVQPVQYNLFAPMATSRVPRIYQGGGHSLGFAYDPKGKKCYFMDPNYGEWVLPNDPFTVANLLYDVLKTYTAGTETGFSNPLNICRSIYHTRLGLFSTDRH